MRIETVKNIKNDLQKFRNNFDDLNYRLDCAKEDAEDLFVGLEEVEEEINRVVEEKDAALVGKSKYEEVVKELLEILANHTNQDGSNPYRKLVEKYEIPLNLPLVVRK